MFRCVKLCLGSHVEAGAVSYGKLRFGSLWQVGHDVLSYVTLSYAGLVVLRFGRYVKLGRVQLSYVQFWQVS